MTSSEEQETRVRTAMPNIGVVVAIDVDNLLISAARAGQSYEGYSLKSGFEKMFEWIRTFGNILSIHLYLPASQSINDELWHELWERYHSRHIFETVYCPKRRSESGRRVDDVDQHLITHTEHIIDLFGDQVGYFCLVSGDLDYSSFLWKLKRERNIEIAFAMGSEESFSKVYRQMNLATKHPVTSEELIYCFSPYKHS
jgi:hypothetical protein